MACDARSERTDNGRSLRWPSVGHLLMGIKHYWIVTGLDAGPARVGTGLDNTEWAYVAFSGGKDTSVLLHLVMEEAIRRGQRVGVLFIDFEAQYSETIKHIREMFALYKDHIDPHW